MAKDNRTFEQLNKALAEAESPSERWELAREFHLRLILVREALKQGLENYEDRDAAPTWRIDKLEAGVRRALGRLDGRNML